MDRVVHSLLDVVIILFLLGVAIGFLAPMWSYRRPGEHLTIEWQSRVLRRRVPRSR